MAKSEIIKRFKPTSILDFWTIAVFLMAVGTLFVVSDWDPRVFQLFLLPPTLAFLYKNLSERTSSRIMAVLFLSSIDAGVALAPVKGLFPNLGGVNDSLSGNQDRILAWYLVVYLTFVFGVLPGFLFTRGLIDHFRKRAAQFSIATCALGLVACVFVAPLMFFGVTREYLGLTPVWGAPQEGAPSRLSETCPAGKSDMAEGRDESHVPSR